MMDAPVVVVKVGTKVLCDPRRELDLNYLRALVRQLAELQIAGHGVVLVTSGAIRTGLGMLGLAKAKDLRVQQAAAAVGQIQLMRLYADFFRDHGRTVAQILLTRADVADRRRYLNARNTLSALLSHGVVPIINENDSVAVEEIQFGENDQLAAQVVQLVGAELLIFMTDTDGFYMPDETGEMKLVRQVDDVTEAMLDAASGSISGVGTGGMATKLMAARMATRVGCKVIMCRGKDAGGLPPVAAAVAGQGVGTTFLPVQRVLKGRKRWLSQSGDIEGELTVDAGAAQALSAGGHSLLAVGIKLVTGDFLPGALVKVNNESGLEIARGLVNYGSGDLAKIMGLKSWNIETALGFDGGAEVIHADNLALSDELVGKGK